MKRQFKLTLISGLLIGFIGIISPVGQAQTERSTIRRSTTRTETKKAEKSTKTKASESKSSSLKRSRTVDKVGRSVNDRNRDKSGDRSKSGQKARQHNRKADERFATPNQDNRKEGRVWDNQNGRDTHQSKRYNDNRGKGNDRNRNKGRYHNRNWNHSHDRQSWQLHPYWKKHHRPRKQFYLEFGWSPFFYLNLAPRIRFAIYTRPLIHNKSHIIFTREYDRYDYRPGDIVGYSVHINFNGRVQVYDRYYDRSPVLVKEFYTTQRTLHNLERILAAGRYSDDNVCLLDNYGDDDHPGYATIAYRRFPGQAIGTVSLNLAAPSNLHPVYFIDLMVEIDELLIDCGYFSRY